MIKVRLIVRRFVLDTSGDNVKNTVCPDYDYGYINVCLLRVILLTIIRNNGHTSYPGILYLWPQEQAGHQAVCRARMRNRQYAGYKGCSVTNIGHIIPAITYPVTAYCRTSKLQEK